MAEELIRRVRPSRDQTMMNVALVMSRRSTCRRREVGCVLVDALGHVLATGYNGVAMGTPHCLDVPCPGAAAATGQSLERCQAIHAEANALLQCRDPMSIDTAYCTTSPCIHCVKLLMNTGCRRIVYGSEYAHKDAARLWVSSHPPQAQTIGRLWVAINRTE